MVAVISAINSIRQRQTTILMNVKALFRPILARKSFLSQITGAGLLAGTSDVLCQKFVEKHDDIDVVRVARFSALVSCLMAPLSYKWFQYIEKAVPIGSSAKWKVALKRTALDQIIAAPIFTSIFLFNLNILETKSVRASIAKTANVFVPILSTNYKIWPFVQYVNLSIIPLHFRVVMIQIVGLFWNMYISFMQHKSAPHV